MAEKFNYEKFIDEIKNEIDEIVRDTRQQEDIITPEMIIEIINYTIECRLTYYDYDRDFLIINKLEPEVELDYKVPSYDNNISAFLNILAKIYLTTYLTAYIDQDFKDYLD